MSLDKDNGGIGCCVSLNVLGRNDVCASGTLGCSHCAIHDGIGAAFSGVNLGIDLGLGKTCRGGRCPSFSTTGV